MAINPPSDIVLDVARAADPLRRQAAAERLARLASQRSEGVEAARADDPKGAGAPGPLSAPAKTASVSQRAPLPGNAPSPAARLEGSRAVPQAFVEFEAVALQTFLQAMLPKDAASVFGKGTAGEVWKSMLAEKLAAEIARSGGLGIAQSIAGAGGPMLRTAAPVAGYLSTLRPAEEPALQETAGTSDSVAITDGS